MIDFTIRQIFPAFLLADKNGCAMAKAIAAGLNYFLTRAKQGLDIIGDYDAMPEWRLDEAAWEYNITWYDPLSTAEEKRQTLKDAMDIYAISGTPEAVLTAFNGVFGAGQVQEWWDYDGDPGHFNIFTTNTTTMSTNYERFMRIVNAVKNVRSTIDGIYYRGNNGTAESWTMAGIAGMTRGSGGYANNYSEAR